MTGEGVASLIICPDCRPVLQIPARLPVPGAALALGAAAGARLPRRMLGHPRCLLPALRPGVLLVSGEARGTIWVASGQSNEMGWQLGDLPSQVACSLIPCPPPAPPRRFHRTCHASNLGWSAHVVHHSSPDFNLSTALRQGAGESVVSNPGGWQRAGPVEVGVEVEGCSAACNPEGRVSWLLQESFSPSELARLAGAQISWAFYLPLALFCPLHIYALHRGINTVYQVSGACPLPCGARCRHPLRTAATDAGA